MPLRLLGHGQREAFLVRHRIPRRGFDHAAGTFLGEAHLGVCQGAVGGGLHHSQQVAFQQRQHHLGLRVAKAAVVLNDLRPLGGQHQAKVQAALEGPALGVHGPDGGQENFFHAPLGHFRGVIGVGGHGAHTAGIKACVVIPCPLVVHGGHHGLYHLAIGKAQNADLGAGEEFLNDHMVAAFAEDLVGHHVPHRRPGFLPGGGNDHAFAQGQTVGLDDCGHGGGFQILKSRLQVVKNLIFCRGNTVLFHQVFGKYLTALNNGGVGSGSKTGDSLIAESIHRPQNQGVIRSHHGVIHLVFQGERHNFLDFRGPDGNADRILCHAAIAGQGKNSLHGFVFFQLFNNGMLSSAATDYQNFHIVQPFFLEKHS